MKRITVTNAEIATEHRDNELEPGKITSVVFEGPEKMEASDGYHTFAELYEHRIELYITLCEQISYQPYDDSAHAVWRSKLHHDGTSFDGWFVLGIGKKRGEQITYHLPLARWNDCAFAEELDKAPEFDGHTSRDVIGRLRGI